MKHNKGEGARLADKAWRIRYEHIVREDSAPDETERAKNQVLSVLQQAVAVSKEQANSLDLAYSLSKYAQIRGYIDGPDVALSIFQEAVDAAERGGSAFLQGHALRHMADLLCNQKQYDQAEPLYEKALSLLESDPETDPLSIANLLRPQAILLEETGRIEESVQRWQKTREAYARVGIKEGVDECDDHLAKLSAEG